MMTKQDNLWIAASLSLLIGSMVLVYAIGIIAGAIFRDQKIPTQRIWEVIIAAPIVLIALYVKLKRAAPKG